MSNAHLPNSHPDVTPNWEPPLTPRAPFLDAIATSPVPDVDNRYSGFVDLSWCAQAGRRFAAHGGFCAAVLLAVARRHHADRYPAQQRLSPVHMHVDYLEPMPQGPFHATVTELHLGGQSISLLVQLVPVAIDDATVYSVALVRLGTFNTEVSDQTKELANRNLPDRDTECERWSNPLFYHANPATASVRVFCPNDGPSLLWSPRFGGQNCRYQWTKSDEGDSFQVDHIPLIVDLIPHIPLNYIGDAIEGMIRYKMPTMALTLNFYAEIGETEWLLTQTSMQVSRNRRFDMNILVRNETG